MAAMMRQVKPALAARRDMEKIFKNGCNSPHVRQMNENLRRATHESPSLQDERDARLPMPLVVQEACDAYVNAPTGDSFGYRLTSCSCMAQQVGKKIARLDKIALRKRFDSLQLALVAYKYKTPGLVSRCLTLDTRPGAKPPQPSPTAKYEPAAPPRAGSAGRTSSGGMTPRFKRVTPECEEAIIAARDRAAGDDWCGLRRQDITRIVAEMEKVNQTPLCEGLSAQAQARLVEYVRPEKCEVQRTGTPSEEEARVVERIMMGRFCPPLSDPGVESFVQASVKGMSRTAAEKHLRQVGPIFQNEYALLVEGKVCAGNYLLWKLSGN